MTQETSTNQSDSPKSGIDYLSYDEQWRIRGNLEKLVKGVPLSEKIFYEYGTYICAVPISLVYFMSWRAGFRGYGLHKYGKGRVLTLLSSFIFPFNGAAAHIYVSSSMVDPYRKESPWYWGRQHAIYNQLGVVSCIIGPIGLTFIMANKMSILPIPDGMHKPGVREIAAQIFYSRVKKYMKPIAITALASTAISFCVGVAAYNQSCSLLAKMGRRTLAHKEDSTKM